MKSKIQFQRTDDMNNIRKEILFEEFDNPRYQFLFGADWDEVPIPLKEFGWSADMLLIIWMGNSVGYIKWDISRTHNKITNPVIAIKRKYLDKGIGVTALVKWLDYMLVQRRFRKIEFQCHADNAPALRLYSQITDLGGKRVGVAKKGHKLHDGKYHDVVLFEILRDNFQPTDFFNQLLERNA